MVIIYPRASYNHRLGFWFGFGATFQQTEKALNFGHDFHDRLLEWVRNFLEILSAKFLVFWIYGSKVLSILALQNRTENTVHPEITVACGSTAVL